MTTQIEPILETENKPQVIDDLYFAKRKENDLDLVTEIRNELLLNGLHQEVYENYDQDWIIQRSLDKSPFVQQQNLTQYWALQLSLLDQSTFIPRMQLNIIRTQGQEAVWLKAFKEYVLPIIVEYRLPFKIH